MTLTLQSAATLLNEHHLLREIITPDQWTMNPATVEGSGKEFTAITYSTQHIVNGAIMCCKGRFKPEYLKHADELGMAAYVAEHDYSDYTQAPGLIVNNESQALSLLAQAFYDYPQDELTLIGITGTKGKTTTAYLTHAILNAVSGGKAALFSSVDNCLDGEHYHESDLTTPESLDAIRMMREAVSYGMQYLVMEVSSQAYKVNRVYGLNFDAAAFLNISPDHISPIEHPTFEDYLYCKRRIVANADALVLGVPGKFAPLIEQEAALAQIPVTTFSLTDPAADVTATPANAQHTAFAMRAGGQPLGDLSLAINGDFNYANAAAAIALAHAVGVDVSDPRVLDSMRDVRISGRMEETHDSQSNTLAIVDYAHNYASVNALLDYVEQRYGNEHPHITLVTGSAGNKAIDRRKEIIEAAQHRVQTIILTQEDSDTEPFEDICAQMYNYVTDPHVERIIELDRPTAVQMAVDAARARDGFDVLLIIGKGDEQWIKVLNKHVPYEGDEQIIRRLFA